MATSLLVGTAWKGCAITTSQRGGRMSSSVEVRRLLVELLPAVEYSDEFFFEVHRLVESAFAKHRYELGSQLRRAALSVPANIVEGLARRTSAEQSQFLVLAWASLLEADYYLSVAQRLGYLDEGEHRAVDQMARRSAAALAGLMKAIGAADPARPARPCSPFCSPCSSPARPAARQWPCAAASVTSIRAFHASWPAFGPWFVKSRMVSVSGL